MPSMYDPNNPQQQVPGMMQTMGAGPKPANSYAIQQGGPMAALQGQGMGGRPEWKDAFQQARMDWRNQMPVQGDMSQMDWRTALMGWKDMKPDRGMFRQGQMPGAAPIVPQPTNPAVPPMSQPINGQLPLNPYGG